MVLRHDPTAALLRICHGPRRERKELKRKGKKGKGTWILWILRAKEGTMGNSLTAKVMLRLETSLTFFSSSATPRGRWAPRCSRGPAIEGLLSDQDHYYGTLKEGVAVTLMLRKGLGARGQVRFGRKERLRGEGKEGNGNELQRHRKKQYVIGLRRE